jgi:imidazoleglycerol phosphate dehydratase HisB
MTVTRTATLSRKTGETDVALTLGLSGSGAGTRDTGVGFFDHMLETLARHALLDLQVEASGDLHVDEHHLVEDVGLSLGEALSIALGERRGIRRFGFVAPMDESLAEAAIDLGGRPFLVFRAGFRRERVGDLPTEVVREFFRALSDRLRATLHLRVRYGRNDHHKIEALFKAFALALRAACEADARRGDDVPSSKGTLTT